MPLNALYHVANRIVSEHIELPPGVKLLEKHNKNDYYIFNLPLNSIRVIGEYTLTEHHVSVYKKPLSDIDKKCQYHYTALFTGTAGKKFRLHVYYDGKDHCVLKPQFSVEVSPNTFQTVSIEEYDEAFKVLAHEEIAALVSHLRAIQNKHLATLSHQYEELEKKAVALSVDLVANKDQYLAIIEQQLSILEEQKVSLNNSWDIIPKINDLKKRRENILAKPATAVVSGGVEETFYKSDEKETGRSYAKNAKASTEKYKVKSDPKKVDIIQITRDLKKRVNQLALIKKDEQPQFIAECYNELLVLEVENPDSKVLDELKHDIEDKGKKLLDDCLTTKQYVLATKLKAFYPLVSEKILNIAIQLSTVKTEFLDFLLTEKILPADYKNFSIKGVTYSSLMAYYFEADIPVAAKMNGLKILISHGVSLMAMDKTGFPYVARALLQPNHSLHALFKENPDLILYYKQLNAVLNMVAARPNCTEEGKAQINQLIEANKKYLASNNASKLINKLSHLTQAESAVKPATNAKAQTIISKLRSDPLVSKLRADIQKNVTNGLKSLKRTSSSKMEKVMGSLSKLSLDQLELELTRMNENDIPDYEKIKEIFIKQQCNVLEFQSLYFQAPGLRKPASRGLGSHKLKQRLNEYDSIIQQMEVLSEEISRPYTDLMFAQLNKSMSAVTKGLLTAFEGFLKLINDSTPQSATAQTPSKPASETSDGKMSVALG